MERQLSAINISNSILFWHALFWCFLISLLTFNHIYSSLLCPSGYFAINTWKFTIFSRKVKNSQNCKILRSIRDRHIRKSTRCTWNIFHVTLMHLLCEFLPQVAKRSGIKKLVKQVFKGSDSEVYKISYQ